MGCTSSQPKGKKMMGKSPSVSASDPHVFLAVNGSSGGLVAKELLDMSLPRFSMRLDDDSTVWVSIFNLKDEDAREQGFQEAAELVKNGTNVRVVACGGDGTVKWVISCLARHSALEIPIGVIPFGTGNDLSRVMGWGSKPPSPLIGVALKALRAKIQTIFDAEQIPLDVWICTIDIGDSANAKFEEVKDKKIVQTHHDKKSLSHEMINYFSLGADGQLMFGFEQNRTSSQAANKRVYAQQGFYQTISRPNRLSKYVKDVKFSTNHDGELGPLDFKRRDRQLLFLNIPSYAAGADLWGTPSSSKTGNGVELTPQFVGDQKVEVLTIRSTSDVGLSLSTGSKFGIRRTTQGQRFQIEFEANTDAYFQIDGEALKACDVRTVSVRHGFQVQMLKSKKGKAVAFPAGFVPPVRHATEEEANAKEMASAMDESRASLADSSNLGTSVKATGIEASSRALLSKRHLVTANDSEASEFDAADDGQLPTVDEETSQENGDLTKTNGHSQTTTASTEENESVQAVDATVTSEDVSLSSENNDAVTISTSKETDESTTNTSSTTKETDESTISKKGKEDSSITNADEPPNSSTAATTT